MSGRATPAARSRRRRLRHSALAVLLTTALTATVTDFSAAAAVAAEPPAPVPAPTAAPAPAPAEQVRPDLVSAQQTAKASGREVLVEALTTETSRSFAQPNGTIRVEAATDTVRIRRGDGWADVDPTLTATGGKVAAKTVPYDLALSPGGTGPLASLSGIVDGQLRKLELGWPAPLPAPTLNGPVATYPDVLPGTDLTVTATRKGYEQSLVVKSRPASALSVTIPVTLSGLKLTSTADGGLQLTDPAGKLLARVPQPRMWGAAIDPGSGEPAKSASVAMQVVPTPTGANLILTPDPKFLADPAVTYPVTVDAGGGLGTTADTWVQTGYTSNQNGSTELKSGTYDGGANKARSYLQWNTSSLTGKHILGTYIALWNSYSFSCAARPTYMQRVTSAWNASTITYNNGEPTVTGNIADPNISLGTSSACPAGFINFVGVGTGGQVRDTLQGWADNAFPNYGVRITGSDTDSYGWKRWNSSNQGTNGPGLIYSYNSYPGTVAGRSTTPCSAACGGTAAPVVITNTATPVLHGGATDADGGTNRVDFEVWNSAGTALVTSGNVANVAAGGNAAWTVPAAKLVNGTSYQWRARAYDGTDYSKAWSSWIPFTVDTTAPTAPAVTSSTHPANTWSAATSGSFAWSSPSTDVASWQYALDSNAMTGTTATSVTGVALTAGPHTFNVQAKDKAGNLSNVASYSFSVGSGSLDSPKPDDRTQQWSTLSSSAPSDRTGVTYRYRRGADGNYVDIPTANVTSSGTPVAGWPLNRTGGNLPSVVWNAKATLDAAVGGEADDQPVQLIACFTGGAGGCTPTTTIAYARHTFGDSYATDEVGPGTVSLLTGDYSTSATDVTVPSSNGTLTLGRTSATFAKPAAGAAGVFGPGWAADLTGPDAGAASLRLDDRTTATGGYASLTDTDGSVSTYLRTSTGTGYPQTFAGTGDASADGTTLTKTTATTYTLGDGDGTVTTYTSSPAGWQATAVTEPGSNTATSYAYDATANSTTNGLVTRILGPVPAGVTCPAAGSPLVAGCRALLLEYGTVPGSGTAPRLLRVKYAVGVATPVEVATYGYDPAGRLASVYDPRADVTAGQHLITGYTYTGDGKLQTVTPPGQAAWTVRYGPGSRLASVTRPTPTGPATETVAYDLPLSGVNLPDLTAGQTDRWGQTDKPLAGAAVFPASHAPAGDPTAAGWKPADNDWPSAKLTYYDVNGRPVNTAGNGAGGWQVDVTEYNAQGNTIRQLTEGNRALALTDLNPAKRATELDTQTKYSTTDPALVTDTYGPEHAVTLNDGTMGVSARLHTSTAYDQGAPTTGGPYRLATTVTTAPCIGGSPGACTDQDKRVTVNGYEPKTAGDTATSGWTLRQPTAITTRMGANGAAAAGGDVTRVTYYNSAGQTVESRQPREAAAGGGPGSTLTRYYTATNSVGDGKCVNADWAGLACTSGPAAQPTSGPSLPVKTITSYTSLGLPQTTVEDSGAGATTRTTTVNYFDDGKVKNTAVTATGSNPGTALPLVTSTYDPATGLPTGVTSTAGTISTGYDNLGRTTSYTDATGATTTTTYDAEDRPVTVNDGKGTTTYTYDGGTEHRGLLTGLDTGMGTAPSTFGAGYDADGNLVSQTYPNGVVATSSYDTTGDETSRTYTKPGVTDPLLDLEQTTSGHGQVRTDNSPLSNKTYTYDPLGRLTSTADVRDIATISRCTTRTYGFDNTAGLNSNRTSLTSAPDSGADPTQATCGTTGGTTGTHSYDTADRLTDPGYSYDNLGRTLTIPAADSGGTATSNGYYVNDLVASQTQGSRTRNYALDPTQQRMASWTDGTASLRNHYTDSTDEPAWTDTTDTANPTANSWTRNIESIGGDLAATQNSNGTITLQLANLHGDIVATMPDDPAATTLANTSDSDEYGNSYADTPAYTTYGWLGAKQRSHDTLADVTLMGVRLYQPRTGRFLSVDPILGGNDNAYAYPSDPINSFDLNGQMHCGKWCHRGVSLAKNVWKNRVGIASTAAFGVCVFASAGLCGPAAAAAFYVSQSKRIPRLATGGRWHSKRGWWEYARGTATDALTRRFNSVRRAPYNRGFFRTLRFKGPTGGKRRLAAQVGGLGWSLFGW